MGKSARMRPTSKAGRGPGGGAFRGTMAAVAGRLINPSPGSHACIKGDADASILSLHYDIFQSSAERFDLDPANDVIGESIGQQAPRFIQANAARTQVENRLG